MCHAAAVAVHVALVAYQWHQAHEPLPRGSTVFETFGLIDWKLNPTLVTGAQPTVPLSGLVIFSSIRT